MHATNNVIVDRCRQSRALIRNMEQVIPPFPSCCRRHDFAVCAVDLATEHHRSIVTLIEAQQFGSAAALLRPLLEASTSAFWLLYSASEEHVLALPKDSTVETSDHDIPTLSKMAEALLPDFPAIKALADALSPKGNRSARWLHKYTHGGTPQLTRRDKAGGWLEGEIILALIRADLFAVLGASAHTTRHPSEQLRKYVFDQRDALGAELVSKFEGAVPDPLPRMHPASKKACCGQPLREATSN